MKKLELILYGNPDVDVREGELGDTDDDTKDKKRLPFVARKIAVLKIKYGQEKYCIHNDAPFYYDGATIPFGLCKGDTRLLTPALFHDLMCQDKSLIGYNRFLSSLIFYKLLRMFKVNFVFAFVMFVFVDLWQRHIREWKREK